MWGYPSGNLYMSKGKRWYVYIYIYVFVTNSKIDLNLKFFTWSARYWYESIHQSYPHIPASIRQCPIRTFLLLTSLLTVNRKLWHFWSWLVIVHVYIYIYIHDVCSVRQCNRMKCKYDSMYVSSLTFSRIEPWSFSPSQRANMWSSRRRTPARPPAPARKTTLGTPWIPWRCRMWSWPLTHATWRSILAKNVLMSVYKR